MGNCLLFFHGGNMENVKKFHAKHVRPKKLIIQGKKIGKVNI